MIDPVKLAERHELSAECADGRAREEFHRDTATALRLLAAYAEAAGAEVEAWRHWDDMDSDDACKVVDAASARTDAARAALVAAGIRVGGGA